jgi:predicted DNA-binding transcriptional regulator AlpA
MIRLLRFKDLRERGIIKNWPMLKRRIERDGFPVGIMVGSNSRAWIEEEVEKWIKSRPTAGPAPRGIAKIKRDRVSKADAATTTA